MTLRAMGVRYHPAVELVEVIAVAMKYVRVSRKTTQMQKMLHRIPKREWITDSE